MASLESSSAGGHERECPAEAEEGESFTAAGRPCVGQPRRAAEGTYCRTATQDGDTDEAPSSENGRVPKRNPGWAAFAGVAVLAAALGFLGGRSSARTAVRVEAAVAEARQAWTDKMAEGQPAFVPFGEDLPAFRNLELHIVNISRQGPGLAPWQFAIQGDTLQGNPQISWQSINGMYAIVVDPDVHIKQHHTHIRTRFRVSLENNLNEPTLLHFHGLIPPNNLDGIPWISSNPIEKHHVVFYDFILYERGFFWLHSHFGHQLEGGLFAPIIVKDHPDWLASVGNPQDVLMVIFDGQWRTECAYQRDIHPKNCPIELKDNWKHYQVSVNFRYLPQGGAQEVEVQPGRPVRLRILEAGIMAAYRIHLGGLQGEVIATDGMHVKRGVFAREFAMNNAQRIDILLQIPPEGGRWDILAQRITTFKPEESAERGVLVLKTPGAASRPLPPGRSPVAVAPYDMGAFMDFEARLSAKHGILDPHRPPDAHHVVRLTGGYDQATGRYKPAFTVNDQAMYVWPMMVWCKIPDYCVNPPPPANAPTDLNFCQSDSITSNTKCTDYACGASDAGPIQDGYGRCLPEFVTKNEWAGVQVSDCHLWKLRPNRFLYNEKSLEVCYGDRVWITYISQTPEEGHPMHLHGTHQQLIQINDKPVDGALRDTWMVPRGQSLTVAFDAYNPGEWLLHCHIGLHMIEGMATTLRYRHNTPRCLAKNGGKKWANTPGLPVSEWPRAWHKLWNKLTAMQTGPPRRLLRTNASQH